MVGASQLAGSTHCERNPNPASTSPMLSQKRAIRQFCAIPMGLGQCTDMYWPPHATVGMNRVHWPKLVSPFGDKYLNTERKDTHLGDGRKKQQTFAF